MRKALLPLLMLCNSVLAADLHYPKTERRPVVDRYGPVRVTDDYRWLEDASAAETKQWVAAQNALTRSVLDAVPQREAIGKQLLALNTAPRLSYSSVKVRGGRLFAMKYEPPREQAQLVVLDTPGDPKSERVLFDPNAVEATSIDWYVPSLDGKRIAISMSKGGSEDGTAHVYDVATATPLADVIPRVNYPTAGGGIAWNADGSGFWYTRYPQGDERPKEDINFYQQVYFHTLGSPVSSDTYAIGKEFPRIAEISLSTSDDGRVLLAEVLNGDGGEAMHWIRKADGTWVQVTRFADAVHKAELGADGALYLLSHNGAPNGKILRVDPRDPQLAAAELVVPAGRIAIDSFTATKGVLYVTMMNGGPSELVMFDRGGNSLGSVPVPPISAVYDVVRVGGGDDVLVRIAGYTSAPKWLRFDAASKSLAPAPLRGVFPATYDDVEVVREYATSKDGTKVPLNIVYRKGTKRDGTNPTLLNGYGGYSINQRPGVSLSMRVWLDHGGVFAIANLRGGAEFGEAWHEGGKLLKKQNVFDDFIACAEHLIARKYTSPAKLAIEGGSNGGLLVGAALTQRPELFRAVVANAAVLDMPRFLRTPNGVFNITEYGDPDVPAQLAAMLAYSPYHRVADGKKYPAVLFSTGDNDGRVDPFNSRKTVARMQAATASPHPILLRTTSKAGHGQGTGLSEAIAARTDVFAFLWRELGLK